MLDEFASQAEHRLNLLNSAELQKDLAVLRSNQLKTLWGDHVVSSVSGSMRSGASVSVGPTTGRAM